MSLHTIAASIQLFPDGTIFVHIALILIMIWVLNRTLYKPINRVLESREKSKGGHSSEATELLSQVGEKETRYNKELLDTRTAGYELIEKEQKKSVAARQKKIDEAKAQSAADFDAGKAEIENQSQAAKAEIDTEAEKLADRITASILKG